MTWARINVRVPNRKVARSIVAAVEPDNSRMNGLEVRGSSRQSSVTFQLAFDGDVETFIFTLDDLLGCVHAAIGTLHNVTKREWSGAHVKGYKKGQR